MQLLQTQHYPKSPAISALRCNQSPGLITALREWKTEPDPTRTRMRLLRSRPDRVNKSAVQASLPSG